MPSLSSTPRMRSLSQCGFSRHGGDQLPDLGVQARPAESSARTPAAEEAPAPAVPAQDGLRPDQEQVASPVLVQASGAEPEEFIPSSEAGPTLGAKGDLQLLAEEQILDDEAPTAADGGDDRGKCEPDEFEHRGRIADQPWADRRAAFCPLQPLGTPYLSAGGHGGPKRGRGQGLLHLFSTSQIREHSRSSAGQRFNPHAVVCFEPAERRLRGG